MSEEETCAVLLRIFEGLAHLHDRNFVHLE